MTVKLGILGVAHGHIGAYCRNWTAQPELGVRLVAVWDHDAARARQFAQHFDLQVEDSADALLARDDLQAVLICAETAFHADLAVLAAEAGKDIVLQKPMALTLPQADRIVEAVNRTGVRFTMAWQMRVDPQNLKIKELLDSGEFGKVFMVRRRHGLSMCLNPAFADSWHVDPKMNRDIWADDAAHPIDFIYWLFGRPETCTAELESLFDPRMPNDNGIAIFRYPGGPLVEVPCSFTNPACENTVEIIAEKGSIIQNYGDGPSCNVPHPSTGGLKWFLREKGEWEYSDLPVPKSHGERIAGLAGPLAEFLHGNRPPIAAAGEGREALRMALACYVSSRRGERVSLDDPEISRV